MGKRHDRYDSSGFSQARGDTLVADLEILLGDLCTQSGFCNRLIAQELLSKVSLTAADFALTVLEAEGFDPELEPKWKRELSRVFVARYGSDRISA